MVSNAIYKNTSTILVEKIALQNRLNVLNTFLCSSNIKRVFFFFQLYIISIQMNIERVRKIAIGS